MPRIQRINVGEQIYHVINRGNARSTIFSCNDDYQLFEDLLREAVEKFNMRLLAYCLMPNHWHLILHPYQDGDMIKFMTWLTNTHTRRWHVENKTIGQGHLYQGRYKSFLCQNDRYFLSLVTYVERNPLKAGLVKRVEDWRWSSLWIRVNGTPKQKKVLAAWPLDIPEDHLKQLNNPIKDEVEKEIECAIIKNKPYGDDVWVSGIVKKFNIGQTIRNIGRPRNGG